LWPRCFLRARERRNRGSSVAGGAAYRPSPRRRLRRRVHGHSRRRRRPHTCTPSPRTRAATVVGGASAATALGVPLGTFLGGALGWRTIFYGIGILTALVTVAISTLPSSRKSRARRLRQRFAAPTSC
jgi:hypothetical protein